MTKMSLTSDRSSNPRIIDNSCVDQTYEVGVVNQSAFSSEM